MKFRVMIAGVVCAVCGGAVVVGAQDGAQPGASQPSKDAIIEALSAGSKPTDEHKVLEQLAGSFEVKGTLAIMPGMDIEWESTGKGGVILGGRFVEVNTESKPGTKPVVASKMIFGFDTRRGEYTLWGIDTFGTYSVSASGLYDAATKTLTLKGTEDEGGRTLNFRFTYVFSADGYAADFEMEMSAGKWTKAGHWEAKRTPEVLK